MVAVTHPVGPGREAIRTLAVDTCIACGARSRVATCEGGCPDEPLELVEAADLEAAERRVEAFERRLDVLRRVAEAVAGSDGVDWGAIRAAVRGALRMPVPEPARDATVVPAWGCLRCGRVDAPQPCLDVCIRGPVLMVDAADFRPVAARAAELAEADAQLAAPLRLIATVTPRPGREEATRRALQAHVRSALAAQRPAPATASPDAA